MTDRELDALVAEKVFGLPWQKLTHGTCCTCQVCGHDRDDCMCGWSSEIERAWRVVEKMRELGHPAYSVRGIGTGNHEAGFFDSKGHWFGAIADNASRAICRAALRALASKTAGGETGR